MNVRHGPLRAHTTPIGAFVAAAVVWIVSILAGAGLAGPAAAQTAAGAGRVVVIVVDNSGNAGPAAFEQIREAASRYVAALPDGSTLGVVLTAPSALAQIPAGTSPGVAVKEISQLSPGGNGRLFDAIGLAVETAGRAPGPALVTLITSGGDSGSTVTRAAAVSAARSRNIDIDLVGVGDSPELTLLRDATGGAFAEAADTGAVSELARRSIAAPVSIPLSGAALAPAAAPVADSGPSTILLAIGGLAVFGILGVAVYLLVAGDGPRVEIMPATAAELEAKARDQSTAMSGLATRLSDVAEATLAKQGKTKEVVGMLEKAGINLRPGEYAIIVVIAAFGLSGMLWLFIGSGIVKLFAAVIGLVFGLFGGVIVLRTKAKRRSAKFGEQLSDTLQLLASSLRAGQGLMQAMDSVSKEAPAPTCDEVRRVVIEARLGRDLVDGLRAMSDRVACEDLDWLIPAIEINRDVGGDLAEVLDNVGATIRDRADIKRQVKTLSAEGRLSAYVLVALPFVLAFFIYASNKKYISLLFSGTGLYMLVGGLLLIAIGSFWLSKIIKIEF